MCGTLLFVGFHGQNPLAAVTIVTTTKVVRSVYLPFEPLYHSPRHPRWACMLGHRTLYIQRSARVFERAPPTEFIACLEARVMPAPVFGCAQIARKRAKTQERPLPRRNRYRRIVLVSIGACKRRLSGCFSGTTCTTEKPSPLRVCLQRHVMHAQNRTTQEDVGRPRDLLCPRWLRNSLTSLRR